MVSEIKYADWQTGRFDLPLCIHFMYLVQRRYKTEAVPGNFPKQVATKDGDLPIPRPTITKHVIDELQISTIVCTIYSYIP
jgi:hypothetical protein